MKNMEDALQDQSYSYVENLEKQFTAAQAEIERQMSVWYQRFAQNNEITLAEAKRLLNSGELKEFQWSVGEYIAYGQQNALDGAWMKQLENASARVHISRLDALKLQIQQQAEVLYSNQLDYVDAAARQMYTGSYYHTAFEVQKGLGVGWTMQSLNEDTIAKVLSRPWTADGQTFRDRCWTNKQSLVNSVNTQLTQMIIRGEAPDRAITAISKQFDVSRAKAGRLVMTESAYFSSAGQKDCFEDLGVEQYKIVASFDHDTCELCGALDGKVFKMSEYQVGLTAPPFHPWCRCCTCPYFADMEDLGERWTRDEDGSTHKIPANTTFDQWKKDYVLPKTGWGGIIGLKTGDGSIVAGLKDHFLDQAGARTVGADAAIDALLHPLHITDVKYNERNEPSVQYIGNAATVAYNPDTDTVITTWPTGKRTRKKYGGKQDGTE
jgi:SPP1 gp7 family putative phage head morphogenesis protein